METAVEKSEKEKDQAKAQKCEAWLAKHDEDSRSYVFKEDEVVQARYRGQPEVLCRGSSRESTQR